MFLFDAVAKASILFIKGHSGYSSCSKCTLEGEYINSVCFTETVFNKRTDRDFMNQTDPDHHTDHAILEKIPIKNNKYNKNQLCCPATGKGS